jgi:hypothetical protein
MRCARIVLGCRLLLSAGGTAIAAAADGLPPTVQTAPLGTPLQVLLPQYRLGSFTHMAEILPARRIARMSWRWSC